MTQKQDLDGRCSTIGGETLSMTTFILIVGLVLLVMFAINEAIVLLKWMYEQDRTRKGTQRVHNGDGT